MTKRLKQLAIGGKINKFWKSELKLTILKLVVFGRNQKMNTHTTSHARFW